MLKQMVFQNFINFRERQHLSFENGPNYIIGGNSTGKSSIFELMRRCLSRKKSKSMSSIPDERRIAFTICKFELSTDIAIDIADIDELSLKDIGEHDTLYTGILLENVVDGRNRKMFKFVYILNNSYDNVGKVFVESDSFPGSEKFLQLKIDENMDEIAGHIKKLLKTNETNRNDEELLKLLLSKSSNEIANGRNECPTQCEKLLQHLDNYIVHVFPKKSIGAVQWSNSKELLSDQNYDNADKYADILYTLFKSEDVDQNTAARIFETLTAPSQYTFEKQGEYIYVTYNGCKNRLLKVPDGILESKQFSLLLAHKKYKTLCFDQPDLGMHPHMIEKMRDLVLRTSESDKERTKTIIFISHSPAMIGTWTLDRIHICRHVQHQKMLSHCVKKVEDVNGTEMLLWHEMKNMLFSSAVLFVEGKSDKLLLSSVFDRVLKSAPTSYDKAHQEKLQQIICGIQILDMQGQTSYTKCCKLANSLKIPYMFVVDKDVFFLIKKAEKERRIHNRSTVLGVWKEEDVSKREDIFSKMEKNLSKDLRSLFETSSDDAVEKIKEFLIQDIKRDAKRDIEITRVNVYLDEKFTNMNPGELVQELKKKHVFFWHSGELEDMLCASVIESRKPENKIKEMLFELFLKQPTDEEKRKTVSKSYFLNMAKDRVENLSECLKNSEKMKELFDFMLEFPELTV